MLLVTCRVCGVVGPREQFAGKVTLKGHGECKPCRAAYKRAKLRERPVETLSRRSLTKMGITPPIRIEREAEAAAKADAKAAWREWIEHRAPRWWVDAYWAAGNRKSWTNPRLSDAEAYRLQYRLDESFRLAERVRLRAKKKTRREPVVAALRAAVTGRGKSATLLQTLGYTREQLRTHIERQFKGRMSWQAFSQGMIHIDHIRPLAAFDLSDPDQFREAFSLPNMRPLWAADNLAKSDKVEHLL